jgi:ferric-dicitrate binding protein FerR (iron transport regulator)
MKKNSEEMNDMTRILTGEATVEERDLFYKEIDTDPDKKKDFETMESQWVAASNAMLFKSLDANAAWARQKNEYLDLSNLRNNAGSSPIWKWAAVLILGIGLAYYFMADPLNSTVQYTTIATGVSEVLPVTMADGSVITLNQNTTLEYYFNDGARKVKFNGEAYFDIATDLDRPFVIEMENAYVKVLGTEFNVRTNLSAVDVLVEEGLVEFGQKDRSDKKLLKAGTSGKLENSILSETNVRELNTISWYNKELVFNQSPLNEVFTDLSRTYHIGFQYDNSSVKNCRLTANFSNEKLPNILETLNTIFKVDFEANENTYLVTGESCELN